LIRLLLHVTGVVGANVQPWTGEDAVKLGKTILVVVGASVLLAALVGVASATRLSSTTRGINASWARLNFRGGLGTAECEVIVNGTFHENTMAKVAGLLTGFVTAANITRCARGAVTVLRETLPWHTQYDSFSGTLPNITSIRARIIGVAFRVSEPTFGINCLSKSTTEQPALLTFNRNTATGAVSSASAGGAIRCSENSIVGTLEGTSSSITAHTVTLI